MILFLELLLLILVCVSLFSLMRIFVNLDSKQKGKQQSSKLCGHIAQETTKTITY